MGRSASRILGKSYPLKNAKRRQQVRAGAIICDGLQWVEVAVPLLGHSAKICPSLIELGSGTSPLRISFPRQDRRRGLRTIGVGESS